MQKISRASAPRLPRRSVLWASAIVSTAALVVAGGCHGGEENPLSPGSGAASGKGSTNAGSSGFSGANTGGSAVSSSGGVGAVGAGTSSGGVFTSSGGVGGGSGSAAGGVGAVSGGGMSGAVSSGGVPNGAGGSSGAGGNSGAGGSGGKPCVDVEPPPDPDWPDANCKKWASETKECGNSWFSTYCDVSCGRCVPENNGSGGNGSGGNGGSAGSAGAAGSPGVDCSKAGLPNVSGGSGFTTRYWDCCQPHCAQFDGHKCDQNGTSRTGNNTSSCSGGGAFACYDEAPKAVNDCLSYGYIAKSNPNCGGCYRIQFTGEGQYNAKDPGSNAIKGKQMIVKVSNTGGDVAGNQFDLMIPGGGVGQFNACSKQWGSNDLGKQYGGFLATCTDANKDDYEARKNCVRQNCMKIPAGPARDGCIWFIDWFQIADDPKFVSQQTDCPF